jgi:hypothetical protein
MRFVAIIEVVMDDLRGELLGGIGNGCPIVRGKF